MKTKQGSPLVDGVDRKSDTAVSLMVKSTTERHNNKFKKGLKKSNAQNRITRVKNRNG